MTLSRRDRGILIALLLAVVALAVDRLLLPGPSQVLAVSPEVVVPMLAADKLTEDILPEMLSPTAINTQPPLPVLDVFDLNRLASLGTGGRQANKQPEETSVESFIRRHTLRATVLGPRPVALVGQRMLQVGDHLDGYELIAITERQAVFVSDDDQAVLRVASRRTGP